MISIFSVVAAIVAFVKGYQILAVGCLAFAGLMTISESIDNISIAYFEEGEEDEKTK